MEDEQKRDEGEVIEVQGQSSPVVDHSTVMMTGDEFTGGSRPVSEVEENEPIPWEDPISSLLGSFQSLQSSQSSEREKMFYVPPSGDFRVLQFEDTLSVMDHRSFNLNYESLLLQGKAGNLPLLRSLLLGFKSFMED